MATSAGSTPTGHGGSGTRRFVAGAVTPAGLVVAGSSGTIGDGATRWAWALGLTKVGEQVWSYETADRPSVVERVVPIGEDGSVIVLGHVGPSFDGRGWMARLDPRGEPVWSHEYGEARYGKIFDAAVLGEGRIVGVGGQAQAQGSAETGFWLLMRDG